MKIDIGRVHLGRVRAKFVIVSENTGDELYVLESGVLEPGDSVTFNWKNEATLESA